MKLICVDDEKIMLEGMLMICESISVVDSAVGFRQGRKALEYIKENAIDVAILDIDMPDINGIELGKEIKALSPDTEIIYATGYGEHAVEAFQVHAAGYLLKPVRKDDLEKELTYISNHHVAAGQAHNASDEIKLVAHAFGNFEAYVNGKTMDFKYSKSKELLAYLIDREGSMITNAQLEIILWDDDESHQSYLNKLKVDLIDTLEKAGISDIITKSWGSIGIDVNKVDCDYYKWKAQSMEQRSPFGGEYMSQYSWAEYTCGMLMEE